MYSTREYASKIRKLETALKKSESKILELKTKQKSLRKELKYKTRRVKELAKSRDNWKRKHSDKSLTIKALKGKERQREKVKRHQFPFSLMKLCTLLRLFGGCSYRKIISILQLLSVCCLLEIERFPRANTIQNWVSKLGLNELQKADTELKGKKVVLLVDESIRMGQEKQLLILSTAYEKTTLGALGFKDVKVVYFGGKKSWNGELIQEVIQERINKIGFEVKAILSDEDSKLKRASRLQDLPHLKDICHLIGTCLRKTFDKSTDYQSFIKDVNQFKSKGVNQSLSYLLPPNQRTKARFLNQESLVKWAKKLLMRFEELSAKEQQFFQPLQSHSAIILALKECLIIAKEISLPLKEQGLSQPMIKMLRTRIAVLIRLRQVLPNDYLTTFLNYLDSYMADYENFITKQEGENVPVSSEVIESLFGKYKSLASCNKLTGTTKLNLELPAHCISSMDKDDDLIMAWEETFMTQIEEWTDKHSTDNQLIKRRRFFKNRT